MKKLLAFMGIFCLIVPLVFLGCEGDDGAAGAKGDTGDPGPPGITGKVEQCVVCHSKTGDELQASYDELYQDNVIRVTGLAVDFTPDNIVTTTFTMTKKDSAGDDQPINCEDVESIGIYWIAYTDNNTFELPDGARFSLKPSISRTNPDAPYQGRTTTVGDIDGSCTVTGTYNDNVDDFRDTPGLVVVYGRDETVGTLPARINQAKYPFAALLETGPVGYVSAANNDGCAKCHTDPYLKHGYIYAQVDRDPDTDFWTCKACHLDNGEGGHYEWQLMVEDPARWAELAALTEANDTEFGDEMTPEELEKYAYFTNLKNDVHMSHAMEFPYPQSMSNCVVCHENKLEAILTDSNFKVETCKSCHVETEDSDYPISEKRPPAMETIWADKGVAGLHGSGYDLTCNSVGACHGGNAAKFNEIHTGYDKQIYFVDNAVATKYSAAIKVTIDNASFDNNILTIGFSAEGDLGGLDAADIVPDLLVGLYGWGTKDYIQGPHESDPAGNTSPDGERTVRALEYSVADEGLPDSRNSVYITVTGGAGSWEATVDLSFWADLIAADNVTKVEIGVTPYLAGTDNVPVALNGVSRTFDLGTNKFVANYYSGNAANALVRVETGCNDCHEALATTFHTNDPGRGGNIVICRLCHITKAGGSHLEMQSRSIDSYVHAIHSFQAFDIGDIDFADPVEALHYEHHIEFPYPKHGSTDCESCHNPGKYNAPDQSKSLPGLLSGSDYPLKGWVRNIGDVPQYITGPGTRACGACHRSHAINEDSTGELEMLFSHWRTNGYMEEDGSAALNAKIFEIMGLFP